MEESLIVEGSQIETSDIEKPTGQRWSEANCRYLLLQEQSVPRNNTYWDGLRILHPRLQSAFGEENVGLAVGVLWELIEVEENPPYPESLYQRWKFDHLHRNVLPRASTFNVIGVPTERLLEWQSEQLSMEKQLKAARKQEMMKISTDNFLIATLSLNPRLPQRVQEEILEVITGASVVRKNECKYEAVLGIGVEGPNSYRASPVARRIRANLSLDMSSRFSTPNDGLIRRRLSEYFQRISNSTKRKDIQSQDDCLKPLPVNPPNIPLPSAIPNGNFARKHLLVPLDTDLDNYHVMVQETACQKLLEEVDIRPFHRSNYKAEASIYGSEFEQFKSPDKTSEGTTFHLGSRLSTPSTTSHQPVSRQDLAVTTQSVQHDDQNDRTAINGQTAEQFEINIFLDMNTISHIHPSCFRSRISTPVDIKNRDLEETNATSDLPFRNFEGSFDTRISKTEFMLNNDEGLPILQPTIYRPPQMQDDDIFNSDIKNSLPAEDLIVNRAILPDWQPLDETTGLALVGSMDPYLPVANIKSAACLKNDTIERSEFPDTPPFTPDAVGLRQSRDRASISTEGTVVTMHLSDSNELYKIKSSQLLAEQFTPSRAGYQQQVLLSTSKQFPSRYSHHPTYSFDSGLGFVGESAELAKKLSNCSGFCPDQELNSNNDSLTIRLRERRAMDRNHEEASASHLPTLVPPAPLRIVKAPLQATVHHQPETYQPRGAPSQHFPPRGSSTNRRKDTDRHRFSYHTQDSPLRVQSEVASIGSSSSTYSSFSGPFANFASQHSTATATPEFADQASSQRARYRSDTSSEILGDFVAIDSTKIAMKPVMEPNVRANTTEHQSHDYVKRKTNRYQFEPDTPSEYSAPQTTLTDFITAESDNFGPVAPSYQQDKLDITAKQASLSACRRKNLQRSESSPGNVRNKTSHHRSPSLDIPAYYFEEDDRYKTRDQRPVPSTHRARSDAVTQSRKYEQVAMSNRGQTCVDPIESAPQKQSKPVESVRHGHPHASQSSRNGIRPADREIRSELKEFKNLGITVPASSTPSLPRSSTQPIRRGRQSIDFDEFLDAPEPVRRARPPMKKMFGENGWLGHSEPEACKGIEKYDTSAYGARKRSRSPMKKMFGEKGWLGRSPSEANVQKEASKKKPAEKSGPLVKLSIMDKLKNKIEEFAEKADLSPNKDSRTAKNKPRIKTLTLGPPEQARCYMELDMAITHTANTFLTAQCNQGRISAESLQKINESWKAKGRPSVIEFMYDQATQRELIVMNQHNFQFHGERASDPIRVHATLYCWKGVASYMAVRTFCDGDTVLIKLFNDVIQIIELIGAGDLLLFRLQEIQAGIRQKMLELMVKKERERKDQEKSKTLRQSGEEVPSGHNNIDYGKVFDLSTYIERSG